MLNGLQILPIWQTSFNNPHGSLLGLFGSIYSIGTWCLLECYQTPAFSISRRLEIMRTCHNTASQ